MATPPPTPVTVPSLSTLATETLFEDQMNRTVGMTLPARSNAVARRPLRSPTLERDHERVAHTRQREQPEGPGALAQRRRRGRHEKLVARTRWVAGRLRSDSAAVYAARRRVA